MQDIEKPTPTASVLEENEQNELLTQNQPGSIDQSENDVNSTPLGKLLKPVHRFRVSAAVMISLAVVITVLLVVRENNFRSSMGMSRSEYKDWVKFWKVSMSSPLAGKEMQFFAKEMNRLRQNLGLDVFEFKEKWRTANNSKLSMQLTELARKNRHKGNLFNDNEPTHVQTYCRGVGDSLRIWFELFDENDYWTTSNGDISILTNVDYSIIGWNISYVTKKKKSYNPVYMKFNKNDFRFDLNLKSIGCSLPLLAVDPEVLYDFRTYNVGSSWVNISLMITLPSGKRLIADDLAFIH